MLELTGMILKPICGIYEIRNIETGQCYIGQSVSILSRWATHFSQLATGKHTLIKLQSDWDYYGPNAFKASVVKTVDNEADLLTEEATIALQYIASEIKLYNAAIGGWLNDEERAAQKARARVIAQREKRFLQRKQAKENETWNQGIGNSGNDGTLQTERGIQGGRRISGNSGGASLEGDQRRVCEPQVGLFVGEQGIDTEAGTKRPAPQGMDENGQRREGDCDDTKTFPIFDRHAANELTQNIPEEEREQYLQNIISNLLDIGSAIELAFLIRIAFNKEEAREAWYLLDPDKVPFLMIFNDELETEKFDQIMASVDSYPGGRVAWLLDHLQE